MVLSLDRWIEKVAIVTGVSSGCGAAIAERLVKEGLKVVGLARRVQNIEQLAEKLKDCKGKLYPFKADITNEQDILDAFRFAEENLGPVHILINNAGISQKTTLSNGDTKMWRDVLETNILGLCTATREAVRNMTENSVEGQVIHISSVLGHYVAHVPGANIYPATKFAVRALTETLRQELLTSGTKIRVCSISPGPVETEFADNEKANVEFYRLFQSMPKLLPDDVADAVIYVLSTPQHVQVVGLARRVEKVEQLAEKLKDSKGKLYPFRADISNEQNILDAFRFAEEHLGPVHILVNNASISQKNTLSNGDTQRWRVVLETNVLGLCIATREAVRNMTENSVEGQIIHIGSVLGHYVAHLPGVNIYPATKFAVRALTETLRQELLTSGTKIRVCTICPGPVETEFTDNETANEEFYRLFQSMPKLLPEDIADAVIYVLSTPQHVQVQDIMIRPLGEPV